MTRLVRTRLSANKSCGTGFSFDNCMRRNHQYQTANGQNPPVIPNKPQTKLCENDCTSAATLRCTTCSANLCNSCFDETHKTSFLKRHVTQVLVQHSSQLASQAASLANMMVSSNQSKDSCPKHPNQQLNLYCSTCDLPLCTKCQTHTNEHACHVISSIEEYLSSLDQELKQLEIRCRSVASDLEVVQMSVKKEMTEAQKYFSEIQAKVDRDFQELTNALVARKSELIEQLVKMKEEQLGSLGNSMKNMEQTVKSLQGNMITSKQPAQIQSQPRAFPVVTAIAVQSSSIAQKIQQICDVKKRKQTVAQLLESGAKLAITAKPLKGSLIKSNSLMCFPGAVYKCDVKDIAKVIKMRTSMEKGVLSYSSDPTVAGDNGTQVPLSPRSSTALASAKVDTRLKSVTSCINAIQILKSCYSSQDVQKNASNNCEAAVVQAMQTLVEPLLNTQERLEDRTQCCSAIVSLGGVDLTVLLLKKYINNQHVARDATYILGYLANNNPSVCEQMIKMDGVQLVISIMRMYSGDFSVMQASLLALGHFAQCNALADKILSLDGIVLVILCLKSFSKDCRICSAANFALYMLAKSSESIRSHIVSLGGGEQIMETLKSFPSDENLTTIAVLALNKIYKKNKYL